MKRYGHLFLAFLRASHLTFGGGPAMIALARLEVVGKYKWVSEEEFTDMVALSTALSAPIVTKLAAMIGYRVGGWRGVLAAEFAICLPTTLAVILLSGLIMRFAESEVLKAMLAGVRPVVIVLLLQVVWQMGKKAFAGMLTWVFGAVALVVLLFVPGIHPAFLVAGSMGLGYVFFRRFI